MAGLGLMKIIRTAMARLSQMKNADMSNDDDAKDTEDEEYEHINQAIEEIVVNLDDVTETVESNRAELESIQMDSERMTQIERGWVSTDWLLAPLWLLITLLCLLAFIVMSVNDDRCSGKQNQR